MRNKNLDSRGRFLMPLDSTINKTSSEANLECAREQRLRQGFQNRHRLFLGKNKDLLGGDDSSRDNAML